MHFLTIRAHPQGPLEPRNMALGAAAGLAALLAEPDENKVPTEWRFGSWQELTAEQIEQLLRWLWKEQSGERAKAMIELVQQAHKELK